MNLETLHGAGLGAGRLGGTGRLGMGGGGDLFGSGGKISIIFLRGTWIVMVTGILRMLLAMVSTSIVLAWPICTFYCGSLTSPTFAYVTYQDLRRDRNLKDQTVIVVRAPSETKLEVPDPQEVSHHRHSHTLLMISKNTLCFAVIGAVCLGIFITVTQIHSTGLTSSPHQYKRSYRCLLVS